MQARGFMEWGLRHRRLSIEKSTTRGIPVAAAAAAALLYRPYHGLEANKATFFDQRRLQRLTIDLEDAARWTTVLKQNCVFATL